MSEPLLVIQDLVAGFETPRGFARAVDGVSLRVEAGQTVGLVGESGCGKSATAYSVLRLLPHPAGRIVSGSITLQGRELTQMNEKELCQVRGQHISMIFQEPMSALNPVMKIGDQIAEALLIHQRVTPKAARERAQALLTRVGIDEAPARMKAYPHQLSGGQRQRVVIAMALICRPSLIIADEPTTALDAAVQAQILELLGELQREMGVAVLFITHDLGLVKQFCQRTYVMYAGQIVEEGPTHELFAAPRHPYSRALIASRPGPAHTPKSPLPTIQGRLPGFWEWPSGCRFAPRCPWAQQACQAAQGLQGQPTHPVRCHRADQLPRSPLQP